MVVKYEVRSNTKSTFYYTEVDAVRKCVSLAKLGIRSRVFKVTFKLYKNTEECVFVPTDNPDDYKNLKFSI